MAVNKSTHKTRNPKKTGRIKQAKTSPYKTVVKAHQPISEAVKGIVSPSGLPFIAARLKNSIYDLSYIPSQKTEAQFLTYCNHGGVEIYRRSLGFILQMACFNLFKDNRVVIGMSLANSIYYDFYPEEELTGETLSALRKEMNRIIKENLHLERMEMPLDRAKKLFKIMERADKSRLLRHIGRKNVLAHKCGDFYHITHGPLMPSTGCIHKFLVKKYATGFLLSPPDPFKPHTILPVRRYDKLFNVYNESKQWGNILGVDNVARLNEIIVSGEISEIIKVGEALHEKKIAQIADKIYDRKNQIKLILVAGPSSSGKTTFSKRLSIQLKVNGLIPVSISLDNYFVDRDKYPRDGDGNYDFESLYALDLDLFNEHMVKLMKGEEIMIPDFDFDLGKQIRDSRTFRLEKDQMLIIEGIHGLNEKLTSSIPHENKYKIYVSPLTQLNIDDHTRISTAWTRLLRRIVRDYQFRSYEAIQTLERWPSVRRGESRNIFPYQDQADVMFNSALVYELSVLKNLVEILLKRVKKKDAEYDLAQRLLDFLSYFQTIRYDDVPPTSILREFIGGSSFEY